jgi:hypothetical protein
MTCDRRQLLNVVRAANDAACEVANAQLSTELGTLGPAIIEAMDAAPSPALCPDCSVRDMCRKTFSARPARLELIAGGVA